MNLVGLYQFIIAQVRENGQYTHAAVWAAMAFALCARGCLSRSVGLINPLNHTKTSEDAAIYKAEPYVVAAVPVHRTPDAVGGAWYTGSAGLTYRLIMELYWASGRWESLKIYHAFLKGGRKQDSLPFWGNLCIA
jgi:hypothetical protein